VFRFGTNRREDGFLQRLDIDYRDVNVTGYHVGRLAVRRGVSPRRRLPEIRSQQLLNPRSTIEGVVDPAVDQ